MHELAEQFGVIPFLVEVLLSEKSSVVRAMYSEMTQIEKNFLFNRNEVPLEKSVNLEDRIKRKINRIRKKYDRNRKAQNIKYSCV